MRPEMHARAVILVQGAARPQHPVASECAATHAPAGWRTPQLAGVFFMPAEKESKGPFRRRSVLLRSPPNGPVRGYGNNPAHRTEMTVIGRDMLANPGQFFDLRAAARSRAASSTA